MALEPRISTTTITSDASSLTIPDLNIDCMEELFEWLSLSELRALRQTCRRMKVAVNHYIKTVYPKGFDTYEMCENHSEKLRHFDSSFCKVFKQIEFSYCPLTDALLSDIKHLLSGFETIKITSVHMTGDFHGDFLRLCSNLKHLYIGNFGKFSSSVGNDWLLHAYDSLERLTLMDQYFDNKFAVKMPELQKFFEKNPKVRRFATEGRFLQVNQHWMLESSVQLNQLDVVLNSTFKKEIALVCGILEALFNHGFYHKLHFYLYFEFEQDDLNRIASLHGLERIHFKFKTINVVWPEIPQLKSFCKENDHYFDLKVLAKSFLNIQEICFQYANIDKVLPFMHRCSKLKVIRIDYPTNGIYCHDGIVNLAALNEERKKCLNPSKVEIFVGEKEYLETKAALMKTNLSLIELKRAESHQSECVI